MEIAYHLRVHWLNIYNKEINAFQFEDIFKFIYDSFVVSSSPLITLAYFRSALHLTKKNSTHSAPITQ